MQIILLLLVLLTLPVTPLHADSESSAEKPAIEKTESEKVIEKDGTPVILVGMKQFPDIRLTLDERRRVEQSGVITRIFVVSDPAKAPGHPCAGLHCNANEVCMAYDYEMGGRIAFCAERRETDSPQK